MATKTKVPLEARILASILVWTTATVLALNASFPWVQGFLLLGVIVPAVLTFLRRDRERSVFMALNYALAGVALAYVIASTVYHFVA